MNKDDEKYYLNKFLNRYDDTLPNSYEVFEKPDFLFKSAGGQIGIELSA